MAGLALVTGASSGIGYSLAKELAHRGYDLIICSVGERLSAAAEDFRSTGVAAIVRKGGTVSIPSVYGGLLDKVPFGAAFGKGVTMKMGQTNMHSYMKPLLDRIEKREIDPSYIIFHRISPR